MVLWRVMPLWLSCLRQKHNSGGVCLKPDHVVSRLAPTSYFGVSQIKLYFGLVLQALRKWWVWSLVQSLCLLKLRPLWDTRPFSVTEQKPLFPWISFLFFIPYTVFSYLKLKSPWCCWLIQREIKMISSNSLGSQHWIPEAIYYSETHKATTCIA